MQLVRLCLRLLSAAQVAELHAWVATEVRACPRLARPSSLLAGEP